MQLALSEGVLRFDGNDSSSTSAVTIYLFYAVWQLSKDGTYQRYTFPCLSSSVFGAVDMSMFVIIGQATADATAQSPMLRDDHVYDVKLCCGSCTRHGS